MSSEMRKLLVFHEKLAALSASTGNLSELSRRVLSAILRLVKADSGSIMVFAPTENRLKLFTSVQHPGEISRRSLGVSDGIAGYVFREGKPVRIEDLNHAPPDLPLRRRESGGSFMSFPLRISKKTVGVVNLNRSPGVSGFSRQEQDLLNTVIIRIASIVEKGRLLEEVKRQEKEVSGLYELTNVLYSGSDFLETLNIFLKKLALCRDLKRSAILRFWEHPVSGHEAFEILSSYNLKKTDLDRILDSVKMRALGNLSTKPPAPVADKKPDEDWVNALPYKETNQEMELFLLPLPGKSATKHFLLVSMGQDLENPEALKDHYRFLDLIAKQLCVAFERNELAEVERHNQELLFESAWQNRIYLDISQELASTLDPHLVLQKAFAQFGRLVPFTSIVVLMYDDLEENYQMIVQPYGPLSNPYMKALRAEILNIVTHQYHLPIEDLAKIPTKVYSPQHPDLKAVNRFKQMLYLPIVFVEKVMGLIHIGNRDDKPLGPKDMEKASQFVGIFVASIKNAIIHRQTERLAHTDPLTGLRNHRFFQENLKKELARALRYKQPLSLLILDIDFFKKFNDTYGHLVGDKVLIHVGRIFENSVRDKIDIVARYGGEEFAVLLPETPMDGALQLAERIRRGVEGNILETDRGELKVTLSIGVACTLNGTFETNSDLIDAADQALYEAKENGRNQVRRFEPKKK